MPYLRQDPSAEFLPAYGASIRPAALAGLDSTIWPSALRITQTERSIAQLLSQDSILLPEIVDQIFLVTIQPARNSEDKEVQRMGHPVRL